MRKAKEAFDKQKLNVLQKVDLLAASRSNMFSHALATYQNSLLSFFKKTSKTMNAVSETFKGFQYYEFTLLKVKLFVVNIYRSSCMSSSDLEVNRVLEGTKINFQCLWNRGIIF